MASKIVNGTIDRLENASSTYQTSGQEPVFLSEPLTSYRYDPSLGRHEELILTIKTTLQLEKNDYQAYLLSKTNLGVFGREAPRPYVLGLVASFPLGYDQFDWTLAKSKWAFSAVEPYGIDACQGQMA